jgi:hypothetical protein
LRGQLEPLVDRKWDEVSPVERSISPHRRVGDHALPRDPLPRDDQRAIELGKRFGGTEGHKYINGVLDKLAKSVRRTKSGGRPHGDRIQGKTERLKMAQQGNSEFDLIARHFTRPASNAVLGVGDDCALLHVTNGMDLAGLDGHDGFRDPLLPGCGRGAPRPQGPRR